MKLDSNIAAVVTGGASGLGEATARAFAAKGVKVAIFDRDAEKGEKVAADIGGVGAVQREDGEAERRVGLVDRADRLHPRGVLRHTAAIDQTGGAVVPRAGVDLVQPDHAPLRPAASG